MFRRRMLRRSAALSVTAGTLGAVSLVLAACSTPTTAQKPGQDAPVTTPVTTAVVAGPPAPAVPHPFGKLSCIPRYGIRFCAGGLQGSGATAKDLRILSFDGVPLDADVALPATGRGPFPLIVMLNGLDGSKTNWETTRDDHGIDDVTFASMGYAVLMYTSRGFGDSCGTAASRKGTPACTKGWIHLADQRYEIRDTEYLAGLLADEGLVRPGIAVTGISYGGGQSLELAMLKNRVRQLDGKLTPWTSPRLHIAMSVAAAYAEWPWDDLVTALDPNGWDVVGANTPPASDIKPFGIEKLSWNALLYNAAKVYFVAPEGADPSADLTSWYNEIAKGEPYPASAAGILQQLQTYHSAMGVPMPAGGPAPTVLQNGWTDTLFPATEGLRYAERIEAAGAKTPLLLMFDDVGHGWAQGKTSDVALQTAKAISFLNPIMLKGSPPPETGVFAIGTTCPSTAASGPVASGASLGALASGSVVLGSPGPQTVTSGGGDATVAGDLNPAYASHYCQALPGSAEAGTALYKTPVSVSTTLVGALQIHAGIAVSGPFPTLIGRLWDLNPASGTRQLIEAGDFRPAVDQSPASGSTDTASETVTFDLEPNMYTVAAHHVVELELVGSSSPWWRKSNGTFRVTVTGLEARIGSFAGSGSN